MGRWERDFTEREIELKRAFMRTEQIRELKANLSTMADLLEEAHLQEIRDDHGGDDPDACTYCQAIAKAREASA